MGYVCWTISTHFGTLSLLSMFSNIQPLFLFQQKTKPLYPHPKYLFGIWIWDLNLGRKELGIWPSFVRSPWVSTCFYISITLILQFLPTYINFCLNNTKVLRLLKCALQCNGSKSLPITFFFSNSVISQNISLIFVAGLF